MIIIETTNGPVMVNDREVRGFQFDKENGKVIVTFSSDMPQRIVMKGLSMTSQFEDRTLTIEAVEDVRYVGDQNSEAYKYEGSEIEKLKKQLEDEKRESHQMYEHAGFMREWFSIYQKLGVFIATQAGNLINPNNWTSSSGTAVGVAVCTEKSNYIIGLSSQQVDTIRWATSTTIDKPNVPTSTSESEIITYYDGESYTLGMDGADTSIASGQMRMQSITFGGETLDGYLGSAGEWNDAINNYQAISAAFAKIGDSFMLSSSEVFWTSCEYSARNAWAV